MDYPPSSPQISPKTWIERLLAFFEVLLLSGLVSSFCSTLIFAGFRGRNVELLETNATTVAVFLLVESGITFLLLLVITKAHQEGLQTLGLSARRWKSDCLIGTALAIVLLMINFGAAFIFDHYLPEYSLKENPLTAFIHEPHELVIFMLAVLVAGGIKEEVQRAFILNRFGRYLGGMGVGLVLWSMAFGAGHYIQGVPGITIATIYGFLFGLIYLLRGSLIAPMFAHSIYDTLVLLLYWFTKGSK
jgi:membrane protease YdiL (CAAX protease family)